MFKFFKKKPDTPAEVKLEEIKNLLFPDLVLEREGEFEFYVDYSVDGNLESVLWDLKEGVNDEQVYKTLTDISKKLFDARKIMQAYQEIDKNVKYVVTESRSEEKNDV